jgi:uncharacterized protein (DUF1800 family)
MRKPIGWSARASLASACLSLLFLTSCGGGGGGGGGGPVAPSSLTYTEQVSSYEVQLAVPPNLPTFGGGAPTDYSVAPALPAGLSLSTTTGVITGMPNVLQPTADYVVTASNAAGAATATLTIQVLPNVSENMSAKTTFTDDDIRYFLGRTHFGGKASDFDAVKAMGIPAYVDQMVEFAATPTLESQAAAYLLNTSDPVGQEGGFPGDTQVSAYWLYLMINNPNPFQEVMAFFWHDHFSASTSRLDSSSMYWEPNQINLWRHQGNGNLRQLLLDMSRDWVMLVWLDGVSNERRSPNENFAREFWELFTLGVDNGYTQADIVEAAKAFTGYRTRFSDTTNQTTIEFDTTRHSTGAKTFFGQTIAGQNVTDDYQAVVDITVDNRPVAEFISKKLFEYFCWNGPSAVPTDAMAATLRGGGYELKPLLKQLFKSEAFFSPRARAGIPKNPVETMVGFVRSTGLVPVDPKSGSDPAAFPANRLTTLADRLNTCQQLPTQPPSVNGWPIGEQWLSAQNVLDRVNGIRSCINDRTDQTNAGIDVTAILPPVAQRTSTNVVDTLCDLLHVTATPAEKTQYVTYLDTNLVNGVVTPSPFDGSNATHISERVRGLLYVLAQHPTYTVR